jgi:hypothetical protein
MTDAPTTPAVHPARYSPEVIDHFHTIIPRGAHLHDPYAGDGSRLGELADELYCTFTGTEIEPSFIIDGRVVAGDATDPSTYPDGRFIIVTSPVYPNGIADSWKAQDPSRRRTYRAAIAAIEGADRELHDNNMGRYGYRNTSATNPKRATYWRLAASTVTCWSGATVAIVNVSDFMTRGKTEPVVDGWRDMLREVGGFNVVTETKVKTRRWRDAANADKRVETESVLVAMRA